MVYRLVSESAPTSLELWLVGSVADLFFVRYLNLLSGGGAGGGNGGDDADGDVAYLNHRQSHSHLSLVHDQTQWMPR